MYQWVDQWLQYLNNMHVYIYIYRVLHNIAVHNVCIYDGYVGECIL